MSRFHLLELFLGWKSRNFIRSPIASIFFFHKVDPMRSLARFNSNAASCQQPTSAFLLPVDHCCSGSPRILFSSSPEDSSQFSDILQFFKVIDE